METNTKNFLTPPWDMETAAARLLSEEAAWNSHDPQQILAGYSDDIEMRDGPFFINGKEEFKAFLRKKLEQQLGYTVKLELWGALKGRMAVKFEAEWHNADDQWFRSYGVEVFQFNNEGYAEKRFASQETIGISATERKC